MSFNNEMYDAWKLSAPDWVYVEKLFEPSIDEMLEAMKKLADEISEELEQQEQPTKTLVERLEQIKESSTRMLEYMADDYRYRELFDEQGP